MYREAETRCRERRRLTSLFSFFGAVLPPLFPFPRLLKPLSRYQSPFPPISVAPEVSSAYAAFPSLHSNPY
jgi:hypothetical protein